MVCLGMWLSAGQPSPLLSWMGPSILLGRADLPIHTARNLDHSLEEFGFLNCLELGLFQGMVVGCYPDIGCRCCASLDSLLTLLCIVSPGFFQMLALGLTCRALYPSLCLRRGMLRWEGQTSPSKPLTYHQTLTSLSTVPSTWLPTTAQLVCAMHTEFSPIDSLQSTAREKLSNLMFQLGAQLSNLIFHPPPPSPAGNPQRWYPEQAMT